jgi:hypothetical protein
MASPPRDIRVDSAEPLKLTHAAIIASVAVTLALAAVPWPAMGNRPSGDAALSDQRWLEIASELEDDVPATELLGAPPASPRLIHHLRERGVEPATFRAASERIRRCAANTCALADTMMLEAVQDAPLPEGVAPPSAHGRGRGLRSPAIDLAARLLEDLATHPSLRK